MRGSKTHGGGSMKKRRGAGHRGGRGNAGSGKRSDTKKPSFWKKKYFGMYGFTSIKKLKSQDKSINIGDLPKFDNGKDEIDLTKFGITKLLGAGKLSKAYNIKVKKASKKAVEKIEKAKGKITLLESNTETSEKQSSKDKSSQPKKE